MREIFGLNFNYTWNSRKISELVFILFSALIVSNLVLRLSFWSFMLITLGVLFIIISVRKPEIGILAIVAIIASVIFGDSIPLIHIPGGSFHVTDILLLVFLFMIPIKLLTDKRLGFQTTPLDMPLLLFMIAASTSAANAILIQKLDFNIVMRSFRALTYYLLYFVITNLFREKRKICSLFNGMFGIATLVSLAMLIQAAVGDAVHLMPGRVEAAQTNDIIYYKATRILPPGQTLIFVMFISAICTIALINKPVFKSGHFYLLLAIGSGILLTYNRNYWVSIIIAVFVLVLLISKKGKKRVLAWIVISVILAGLLILPLMNFSGKAAAYIDSISDRFSSLFSVKKTYSGDSLGWRKIENDYAWRSVVQHPFVGIGLTNNYRPRISGMNSNPSWNASSYIHNGYLWILVDMGLLGFVPLMWFFIGFIIRGFSNWRKIRDPGERSILIGCTLSMMALSLCILVSPRFMEWYSIVVIATIMGVGETIIKHNEKKYNEMGVRLKRKLGLFPNIGPGIKVDMIRGLFSK